MVNPGPPPGGWEGGPRTPRRLIWKSGSSSGHACGLTRLWLPASVSSCWSASLSGPLSEGLWAAHWSGSSPPSQWGETPRACGKLCWEVAAAARFPHRCGLSFLFRRRPHPEPLPTRAPQPGVLPPQQAAPCLCWRAALGHWSRSAWEPGRSEAWEGPGPLERCLTCCRYTPVLLAVLLFLKSSHFLLVFLSFL